MRAGGMLVWGASALLVLPAVALTLVRLLGLDSATAVRLVSFAPLALPSYAAALVLLAVALLRRPARGGGGGRLLVAATVAVLAGLGLHAWWLAPLVTGERPATEGRTWSVLTSNLLAGQGDGLTVLRTAVAEDVDVLVLQEVTLDALATLDRAGLAEAYPHRIGEAVPEGRTDGTMVLSRTPLGEPVRVATDMQTWAVEVTDPDGGDPVRLLAVHPAAPTDVGAWRRDHAVVLAAVRELDVDLVAGDLNATLDHAPVQALVDGGWRDATEEANGGWQPTWPSNGLFESLPLPPLVQIDHVLTGPAWVGTSSQPLRVEGTDHLALLVEVARVAGTP
ncbi:endonuclease/exonuclease/phosphatase family protein [Nocardioides ginkgobilobae]